jgi:hypothetical protein
MTTLQLLDAEKPDTIELISNPDRLPAALVGEKTGLRPHVFGSRDLIRVGLLAPQFGFRVIGVDLRHKSEGPSDDVVESAEELLATHMGDGDGLEATRLLSLRVPDHFIHSLTLGDLESGARLTLSRYGALTASHDTDPKSGFIRRLVSLVEAAFTASQ